MMEDGLKYFVKWCEDVMVLIQTVICKNHFYIAWQVRRYRLTVCESGRSPEAIRPELNNFLSLHRWTLTLQGTAH